MDDKISYITKEVHEEFARRMEAENQRLLRQLLTR